MNFPFTLGYMFEDSDEYGDYEIRFSAKNLKTGETAKTSTPLKLEKWVRPEPIKGARKLNEAVASYNGSFDPKTAYAIFASPDMSFADSGGNFAYAMFGFMKTAFSRSRFLLSEAEREFPKAGKIQRRNSIQLFELLGEGYRLKGLDRDETALRDSHVGRGDLPAENRRSPRLRRRPRHSLGRILRRRLVRADRENNSVRRKKFRATACGFPNSPARANR